MWRDHRSLEAGLELQDPRVETHIALLRDYFVVHVLGILVSVNPKGTIMSVLNSRLLDIQGNCLSWKLGAGSLCAGKSGPILSRPFARFLAGDTICHEPDFGTVRFQRT